MLTQQLLSRSLGTTSQAQFATDYSTELLHAIQPSERVRYDGIGLTARSSTSTGVGRNGTAREATSTGRANVVAHRAGVSAIAVDPFEGR